MLGLSSEFSTWTSKPEAYERAIHINSEGIPNTSFECSDHCSTRQVSSTLFLSDCPFLSLSVSRFHEYSENLPRHSMPRVPPLRPSELDPEQRALYDEAHATCTAMLGDKFAWKNADGALIGPLTPLMHSPRLARLYLNLASELSKVPGLPKKAREVAILATGYVFDSRYELYSHERLATDAGLSTTQVEAIKQGKKPLEADALDAQCSVAFDVAMELTVKRGSLSEATWERAEMQLGRTGVMALIQYVALYSYTCILLNAVDEEVP